MILKLDPRWPVIWRSPTSVQIGIDPPRVVLHGVTESDERMLATLAVGVSPSGLDLVGTDAADFVTQLEPALLQTRGTRPEPVVAISGVGELTVQVATALGHHGIRTLVATDHTQLASCSPDVAVVIADYVVPPELHGFWLRRDVPHLAAVFSDTGAHVGPVVEPGTGPCLVCIELHRRRDDPEWASIATQLLSRKAPRASAVLLSEIVGRVGRMVLHRLDDTTTTPASGPHASLRIDAATGEITTREWTRHADCSCAALGAEGVSAIRRGTDSASAGQPGRSPSSPTRTSQASGGRG